MSRRGENIRRRKDGRWEARYPKGRTEEGRIKYCSVYATSYREVKAKLLHYVSEAKESGMNQADITFGELWDEWYEMNLENWKGSTRQKYLYLSEKYLLPRFRDSLMSNIMAEDFNEFIKKLLSEGSTTHTGLSPSYVKTITQILVSVLKDGEKRKLCGALYNEIKKPSSRKKEVGVLSANDQKHLIEILETHPNPTHLGILLGLSMGLRIGEVCALSWDDIDLRNGILHVRHTLARVTAEGKTRWIVDSPKTICSLRDIPIPLRLKRILLEATTLADSPYVSSTSEKFTNPRTFEYRFHKVLEKAGINHVNFHMLRHTFATRCIEAGVDIKSLSEMLGHGSVAITLNTYVHSSIEQKRQQIEKYFTLSA